MMHEPKLRKTPCLLARRLGEIRMSESERRSALEYMRRGERVADCLVDLTRALLRLIARVRRRLTLAGYATRKRSRRLRSARANRSRAGAHPT